MFFKRKKRRVFCSPAVMLSIVQEAHEKGEPIQIWVRYNGKKHTFGISAIDHATFYFDHHKFADQEYDTFEQFKSQALLGGQLFISIQDDMEVLEMNAEKPTIFPVFARYIRTDE